jgi:hypothetical protein
MVQKFHHDHFEFRRDYTQCGKPSSKSVVFLLAAQIDRSLYHTILLVYRCVILLYFEENVSLSER